MGKLKDWISTFVAGVAGVGDAGRTPYGVYSVQYSVVDMCSIRKLCVISSHAVSVPVHDTSRFDN